MVDVGLVGGHSGAKGAGWEGSVCAESMGSGRKGRMVEVDGCHWVRYRVLRYSSRLHLPYPIGLGICLQITFFIIIRIKDSSNFKISSEKI